MTVYEWQRSRSLNRNQESFVDWTSKCYCYDKINEAQGLLKKKQFGF